jgi:iron complex outermembrane receptor protein
MLSIYKLQGNRPLKDLFQPMLVPSILISALAWPNHGFASTSADFLDLSLQQLMELPVIEVTAQRQAEHIQDVPIAITSIKPSSIQAFNAKHSSDLQMLVPGLTFTKTLSAPAVFLRGVGSSYSAAGGESPTAFYIDDVYRSSTSAVSFHLNPEDSIEVLKGPQGTLFGRNATSGVINIKSKEISDTPEASISVEAGNYGLVSTHAYASAPLSSSVNGSFSAYHSDRDGYGKNTVTGNDTFENTSQDYRGKLVVKKWENTHVKFSFDWSEEKDVSGMALIYFPDSVNSITQTPLFNGDYNTTGNVDNRSVNTQYGNSIIIESKQDWARIKSISAYRYTGIDLIQDGDRTPQGLAQREVFTTAKAFTQEIQFLSPQSHAIKWIAGAFFMDETSAYESPETKLITATQTKYFDTQENTQSIAVFGQTTYPLNTATNLTMGLRITNDKREAEHKELIVNSDGSTSETEDDASDSWAQPTWRFALDHKFENSIMGYASYNRGFKAGLFNMAPFNSLAVSPEKLDAFELGIKTVSFNNRLRLNSAIYHYKYKDLQVQGNVSIDNATFNILFNAASATINGLDIDAEWVATENLHLLAGLALIEGQYDTIQGVPFSMPNPSGGNNRVSQDMTNLTLFRTPKRSANIAATYKIPVSFGTVKINTSCSYNSEYFFDAAQITKQDPLTIINASIEWSNHSNDWSVSLWGRNLTDELRLMNANAIPTGNVYSPADPRTFGLKLTHIF